MVQECMSLHTKCPDECGDFGKIWKVFGKHLGGVLISTCFDPRKLTRIKYWLKGKEVLGAESSGAEKTAEEVEMEFDLFGS